MIFNGVYLKRNKSAESEKVLSMDKIAKEINTEQVKQWPNKGLLSCGKLSVKYDVLNRIGATNWAPTNHSSSITPLGQSNLSNWNQVQAKLWRVCV